FVDDDGAGPHARGELEDVPGRRLVDEGLEGAGQRGGRGGDDGGREGDAEERGDATRGDRHQSTHRCGTFWASTSSLRRRSSFRVPCRRCFWSRRSIPTSGGHTSWSR